MYLYEYGMKTENGGVLHDIIHPKKFSEQEFKEMIQKCNISINDPVDNVTLTIHKLCQRFGFKDAARANILQIEYGAQVIQGD